MEKSKQSHSDTHTHTHQHREDTDAKAMMASLDRTPPAWLRAFVRRTHPAVIQLPLVCARCVLAVSSLTSVLCCNPGSPFVYSLKHFSWLPLFPSVSFIPFNSLVCLPSSSHILTLSPWQFTLYIYHNKILCMCLSTKYT